MGNRYFWISYSSLRDEKNFKFHSTNSLHVLTITLSLPRNFTTSLLAHVGAAKESIKWRKKFFFSSLFSIITILVEIHCSPLRSSLVHRLVSPLCFSCALQLVCAILWRCFPWIWNFCSAKAFPYVRESEECRYIRKMFSSRSSFFALFTFRWVVFIWRVTGGGLAVENWNEKKKQKEMAHSLSGRYLRISPVLLSFYLHSFYLFYSDGIFSDFHFIILSYVQFTSAASHTHSTQRHGPLWIVVMVWLLDGWRSFNIYIVFFLGTDNKHVVRRYFFSRVFC